MQVIIAAVPERRQFVLDVLKVLPGSLVVWDRGYNGSWWGLRSSIAAMDEDAVLLQDDAYPCANFLYIIEQARSLFPDTQFMLWLGGLTNKSTQEAATKKGCSWIRKIHSGTGVGQYLPYSHAKAFLMWADREIVFTKRNSDLRLAIWRTINKIPSLYTNPELVWHRGETSTLGTGTGKVTGVCYNQDPNLVLNDKIHTSLSDYSEYSANFLRTNGSPGLDDKFLTCFQELKQSLEKDK